MPMRFASMTIAALGPILILAGCHWGSRPAAPPLAVVPGVDLSRWFLARTPEIGDDLYGRLVDLAGERGFDPARIERSAR